MDLHNTIAVFGIGSTNCRSALARPDGTLATDVHVEPTNLDSLCEQLCRRVGSLQEQTGSIDAVSIATAGLVDAVDNVLLEIDAPDGSVIRDIPIGRAIEETYGLPVTLENDCTAAALAEWTFGAGRQHECDSVVHVTIGTGIGAGVVDRGHVLRGATGHAAEVGLIPVAPLDRDSCGVAGAWEAYCSGRGIASFVSDRLESEPRESALPAPTELTARDVFEVARDGDEVANEYLDEIGRYNAAGLGAVINAYNPGIITIGGGVGGSNFETIIDRTEPYLEGFTLPEVPPIEPTALGDAIGLYGALAPYAIREQREPETSPPAPALSETRGTNETAD